jgi:hypothetical protein
VDAKGERKHNKTTKGMKVKGIYKGCRRRRRKGGRRWRR